MIYKVHHIPSGKVGVGKDTWDALRNAIGDEKYARFMERMPARGFCWSAYTTHGGKPIEGRKAPVQKKSDMYEQSSVSTNEGKHLLTVYRSESLKALNKIMPDELTRIATPAKEVGGDSVKRRSQTKRVASNKARKGSRKL